MAVMAAESVMACSFTRSVSTPSALAASSFSLIATQIGAEARALHGARARKHEADQRERDPEIDGAALELEVRPAHVELDQRACRAAGEGARVGDDAEHLGEGQRDEREIGAAQARAEAEEADGRAQQPRRWR